MTTRLHSTLACVGTLVDALRIDRTAGSGRSFCTIALHDDVRVRVLLVGAPALLAAGDYYSPGDRVGVVGRLAQDHNGLYVVSESMSRWKEALPSM